MLERIKRDTGLICGLFAVVAAVWFKNLSVPLGVVGGGLLMGLSFWAIQGSIDAWVGRRSGGETGGKPGRFHLVKFFTRHVMLALAAYGMMVRLQLDPVAMLVGVTSLGVAVGVEAVRSLRWRRFP
jgi:predicted Na+-dependent transporter